MKAIRRNALKLTIPSNAATEALLISHAARAKRLCQLLFGKATDLNDVCQISVPRCRIG